MDKQQYAERIDMIRENESGKDFDLCPGCDPWASADALYEFQCHAIRKQDKRDRFLAISEKNALRGIQCALWKKHGDVAVSAMDVYRIICDRGYLDDNLLMSLFELKTVDVKRGMEHGIIPPRVIETFSQYFNIAN